MIKQQVFIMPFENMLTHQTNMLIFAHNPEAEPRGILLIKFKMTLFTLHPFKLIDFQISKQKTIFAFLKRE